MSQYSEVTMTLDQALSAIRRLPRAAARSAEYAELAGEHGADVYLCAVDQLDALLRAIKEAKADLASLRRHAHEWNEDNYCSVCGADGCA